MTDIYFSFDTEDFTSNLASDAVRDEANLLHAYGVKGNFNVVGYLAREFVRYRRNDVLDALKNHTASFHSLRHSYHPTLNEYTDIEDYNEARNRIDLLEKEGIGMVKAALDVDELAAACPPGNSDTYVAMYAYADWNIPLYVGSVFHIPDGTGVYFCNAFHTNYDFCLEENFHDADEVDIPALLDEFAKNRRVVLFNHPNRVYYKVFWDAVNYNGENTNPMHQGVEPERYPLEETARYYQRLSMLLAALRDDPRFRFCSMDDLKDEAEKNIYGRTVKREQLGAIREALSKSFRWIDAPVSLSIADCFYAARHFLLDPEADTFCPGKTHGFLYEPQGVTSPVELTAGEIRELAQKCDSAEFLPPYFEINGKRVGPADLLFAMLDAAMGAESVTVMPRRQQCEFEECFPYLAQMQLKGTWMHSPDFEDRWISERLRLQAWTIRVEV